MTWWDYGYQINGIAERTTLADGNTWNHEHIALFLVSNEEIAWETTRHLADYVLCWSTRHSGSMGDDEQTPIFFFCFCFQRTIIKLK